MLGYNTKSYSAGQHAGERIWRLLIPFIFGMLVIVVPQAYYDAVFHGADLGGYSLLQIYWLYLQSLPNMQLFHLWYLRDLFLFSMITIPLFLIRNRDGKFMISRLAALFIWNEIKKSPQHRIITG
jgi:hypothetical protein